MPDAKPVSTRTTLRLLTQPTDHGLIVHAVQLLGKIETDFVFSKRPASTFDFCAGSAVGRHGLDAWFQLLTYAESSARASEASAQSRQYWVGHPSDLE